MENLIIIILAITSVIFIALYFSLHRSLKSIAYRLSNINSTKTNSKILISSRDNIIKKLALSINECLEAKSQTEAEYKRMDLELRQAIANISHDLRTPLTSIMGYMQLIEDDTLSEAERKQYIEIVKTRSKSLQLLISGFYDLSRLEAREFNFEFKPLNMYDIICDITASYYTDFLTNGIEPKISLQENTNQVLCDETAVKRVFSNLIQNILKHGKGDVFISLEQHSGYVSTVFRNDAPHLKEEDVPRLFERFFTGDKTRTEKSTGLGLSITKQLVEQTGNSISAALINGKLNIEVRWFELRKD